MDNKTVDYILGALSRQINFNEKIEKKVDAFSDAFANADKMLSTQKRTSRRLFAVSTIFVAYVIANEIRVRRLSKKVKEQ